MKYDNRVIFTVVLDLDVWPPKQRCLVCHEMVDPGDLQAEGVICEVSPS